MIHMIGDLEIKNSIFEDTDVENKTDIQEPSMYRVIMHNDHYTTMEFVVTVLITVFHKSTEEAKRLMMQIHKSGSAICGTYIYDIAQTKVNRVHSLAKSEGHPLKCTLEEV
jgi:ATP-dependent Clp protease adaptor protein ClpS